MATPLGRERLEFLSELPQLLNSSLSPAVIAETALRYLLAQLRADELSLFLRTRSSCEVYRHRLHIEGAELLTEKLLLADLPRVKREISKRVANEQTSSGEVELHEVYYPLLARETEPIGVLAVSRPSSGEGFSEEDREYVKRFCAQLSLALENAMLVQKLHRSRKQLTESNQKKDDALAVLNHEIQTPLTVFKSSVELLASPVLSDEQKERVQESLNRGIARLSAIARDLQNVTQATSGGFEAIRGAVSVADLFSIVQERFLEVAEKRSLELLIRAPVESVSVAADQTLLLVVLTNLIGNAIRFTPDGGSVQVSAVKFDRGVEFSVQDTGIGIDHSQHEAIFQKFYEVADASHHSTGDYGFQSGGLGLGLATVKGILKAHDSTVVVKSEPGGGSTFSFVLPIFCR
jgi:signal transduction histidine kinase